MDYQDVFERYEYKYFLTPSQKRKLLELSEGRLELDRYGRTTIRNIYYDTDSFRLIRDSLDHPVYKEKLRLRSYQKASDNDPVFIEIKKKYEDIVYKRRIAIPKTSAENWIDSRKPMPFRTQITSEIDYFLEFYEGIAARAFISYEREAYSDRNDPGLRVTFDENILARSVELDLGGGIWGYHLLPEGTTLMEIKIPGAMPLWMAGFLSANGIKKTSFSKYGTYYKDYIVSDIYSERSVFYA